MKCVSGWIWVQIWDKGGGGGTVHCNVKSGVKGGWYLKCILASLEAKALIDHLTPYIHP